MTSHVLALCSKVLFDKQALEDRKELERLKQQCARLARDNDATFCKYKYLLVTINLGFNYQTDELLDTLHRAGGLTTVLERCKVRYAVEEPRFSFSKAPYGPRCVANDVDLLVKIQGDTVGIWLGKRFWGAASISEQQAVYLFMYALHQLDSYFAVDEDENFVYDADTVEFVSEACIDPYTSASTTVPEGMFTFEDFMNEGDFGDHQFF